MKYGQILCWMTLVLGVGLKPATAQVVFEDREFANWSWQYFASGSGWADVQVNPVGGNNRQHLEVDIFVDDDVNVLLFNQDWVWNISFAGAPSHVGIRCDVLTIAHIGHGHLLVPLIEQGGKWFVPDGVTYETKPHQAWDTRQTATFPIGEFVAVDATTLTHTVHQFSGTERLDLSTNAPRMTFGMMASSIYTSPGVNVTQLYDNVRFEVDAPFGLLAVDDPIQGQDFELWAEYAVPGETVYLAANLAGRGPGSCYRALGGQCLDILDPVELVGSETVQSQGSAQFQVLIPATLPQGTMLYFQAAIPRGIGGQQSVISNVVTDSVK